jgi:hypothetical protein
MRIGKMTNQEIIEKIFKHSQDIFCRLAAKEKKSRLFGHYILLCSQYRQGNIGQDFENLYKKYWIMNGVGLTSAHFEVYFRMLRAGENNLHNILNKLSKIPTRKGVRSIQFSFATKLLHTLDNKPIFDRWVGFVFWGDNIFNDNHARSYIKIQARVEKYNELCRRYQELLQDKSLLDKIEEFRHGFRALAHKDDNFKWDDNVITNTRVLDFMVWELGRLLNENYKNRTSTVLR